MDKKSRFFSIIRRICEFDHQQSFGIMPMLRLPELISSGKFEISKQSPLTYALHELITLRNRLMHIDAEARLLTENSDEVKVEGHLMQISVPIPPNPWELISFFEVTYV